MTRDILRLIVVTLADFRASARTGADLAAISTVSVNAEGPLRSS
jgi:hypothetical protein